MRACLAPLVAGLIALTPAVWAQAPQPPAPNPFPPPPPVGPPGTILPPAPVAVPVTADGLARAMIGTWRSTDSQKTDTLTLNPDGTFSAMTEWKRALKRVFEGNVRSSGNWRVADGVLVASIKSSTDEHLIYQVFSLKVISVGPTDAVGVREDGRAVRMMRIR